MCAFLSLYCDTCLNVTLSCYFRFGSVASSLIAVQLSHPSGSQNRKSISFWGLIFTAQCRSVCNELHTFSHLRQMKSVAVADNKKAILRVRKQMTGGMWGMTAQSLWSEQSNSLCCDMSVVLVNSLCGVSPHCPFTGAELLTADGDLVILEILRPAGSDSQGGWRRQKDRLPSFLSLYSADGACFKGSLHFSVWFTITGDFFSISQMLMRLTKSHKEHPETLWLFSVYFWALLSVDESEHIWFRVHPAASGLLLLISKHYSLEAIYIHAITFFFFILVQVDLSFICST